MTENDPLAGFTTRIDVTPAYDYRSDPNDGRGAHGAELHLILTGPLGVIAAVISTGWVMQPIATAITGPLHMLPRRDKPGVDHSVIEHFPSGSYVGSHVSMPGDAVMASMGACEYLDGAPCYGDGSFLAADRVLAKLVEGGSQAAFKHLAELYKAWIADRADAPEPVAP